MNPTVVFLPASRGAASLAAARSQAARIRQAEPGSMSRAELMGVEFVNDDDIGVVELVGRHDAVFAVDLEERDRDHQDAGEFECVGLGE